MVYNVKAISAYKEISRGTAHKDRTYPMQSQKTDHGNNKSWDHEDQVKSSFDQILRSKMQK